MATAFYRIEASKDKLPVVGGPFCNHAQARWSLAQASEWKTFACVANTTCGVPPLAGRASVGPVLWTDLRETLNGHERWEVRDTEPMLHQG